MRTKALLLAAVFGALGLSSALAQVYSVNAVGYVNKTLQPGFNLVANPLDLKADNIVSKVLIGVPDQTIVYAYSAGSYQIRTYDLSGVGGWDGGSGATAGGNLPMAPGEGVWVRIPGTAAVTVTFVGEVMQGALSNPVPAGFSIEASQVPQAGKLATDLGYPATDQDTIYQYDNDGVDPDDRFIISNNDVSGVGGWDPAEPNIAVGEGFWTRRLAAGTWTRTFSVNP